MKCKLSDICDFRKGKVSVSTLTLQTYVSTENMLPNKGGIVVANSLPTTEFTQEYKKGDILVSNIRPYFKKIWQAKCDGGCSNDVLVFQGNSNINRDFLYYILANDDFFAYSMATSKGTKMPRGDKTSIMKYEVPAFDLDTQIRMASVIRCLDEKIELNAAINNNLEQQIKSLYTYYFGEVKNDWKEIPLSDIIFFQEGPGIRNWQYVGDGVRFINIRCINNGEIDISTANMISEEEANGKYAHFMLEPYDIVMSCSGTLGRYAIVQQKDLPLCLNTSVIRFRPKNNVFDYSYIYGYITSNEFLNQQRMMANGSAQINFGPTHLKQIVICEPPIQLRKDFNNIVFPMIERMIANRAENNALVRTRDALLPKLMSGELDVSNIDL